MGEVGKMVDTRSEVEIEPLSGEEREKRAILLRACARAFSLDFVKARFGKEGPILLGRHFGSLEKLGWNSMREEKLSPVGFFARTYRLNMEPMGFKATVYEEIENERASMLISVNPLAEFVGKYMTGVHSLTEEDAWQFLVASFEWVKDYGYKFEAKKTAKGYKLTVTRRI